MSHLEGQVKCCENVQQVITWPVDGGGISVGRCLDSDGKGLGSSSTYRIGWGRVRGTVWCLLGRERGYGADGDEMIS